MVRVLLAAAAVLCAFFTFAGEVSLPVELSNGSVADANSVQQNFQALADESNENDQRITTVEQTVDLLDTYASPEYAMRIPASQAGGWFTIAHVPCTFPDCTGVLGGGIGAANFAVKVALVDGDGRRTNSSSASVYAAFTEGRAQLDLVRRTRGKTGIEVEEFRIRYSDGLAGGALLQVKIPEVGGEEQVLYEHKRLGREHQNDSLQGWILDDWVPDGAAIDSIDYTLLNQALVEEVPSLSLNDDVEVPYLSNMDCSEGQMLARLDGRWACSEQPATSSSTPSLQWVDAEGQFMGYQTPVIGGETMGFEISHKLPGNDRFYVGPTMAPSGMCVGTGAQVYYQNSDCTGTAYVSAQYGWEMNLGANGFLVAPTSLTTGTAQTRSFVENNDCEALCQNMDLRTWSAGDLFNTVQTDILNDLGGTAPFRLEWN